MHILKSVIVLSGLLALAACGGGSSGSGPSTSSPPATTSSSQPQSSLASSAASQSVSSSESSSSSSEASSTSSSNNSSESSSSVASSINASITSLIVVDQFGYLPAAKKIAVLRDPQTGFDATDSLTPSASIQLINADTLAVVHTAAPQAWNGGATSNISGDKVWWFDFSSVTTPGRYWVLDASNNLRSPAFSIGNDVYKPVLKHAFRTFFYQRAGFAKQLPHAETGWTDGASHIGAGQDRHARLITTPGDASTERDLSGGWYDAGDYNKYTNWHADYLITLLHTYLENPAAWTDDFNIPESGNGIPDIIDEIKWGFDWLIKMQEDNGSVLSVMGLAHASPPSAATGPSRYGPATTSATLTSAAAFAFGSNVFAQLGNSALAEYATDLGERAENAWTWANANPSVTFNNTGIIAAGEQEVNNAGRASKKLSAAIYLYADTHKEEYRTFVEANLPNETWVGVWNEPRWTDWLYYASLPGATSSNTIRTRYNSGMNGNWNPINNNSEAYRAYLASGDFTWGSNRTMSRGGTLFYNLQSFALPGTNATDVRNAALGYLNYLHGTNPLGMVYLSNMYNLGVHSSVNEFYHSWFANGSSQWDRVGESTYGPAPGFLVGGPNPSFDWDSCCPNSCGSTANNNVCTSISLTPPKGQPPMKSYLDFNTSWPLNSWQITENHNDYQIAYLRLLSKFVN